MRLDGAVRVVRTGLALLLLRGGACGGGDGQAAAGATSARVDLLGAGATFPYPLYARWFNSYAALDGVRINYQSIGSGGGIRQLIAGTVDFGATDVPMTDEEIARVPGGTRDPHAHRARRRRRSPTTCPTCRAPLRLSPEVIADIFLGRITRWNDPRLQALNPDQPLPDRDVLVVHRSDGSGTSFIFSDYLTAVSPDWAAGPGTQQGRALAGGTRRQGERGGRRPGEADAGRDRLRGGHVRPAEPPAGRAAAQRRRSLRGPDGLRDRCRPRPARSRPLGNPSDLRVSIVNAPGDAGLPASARSPGC